MKLNKPALFCACALLLAGGSPAAYAVSAQNELAASFCEEMADPQIYKAKNLQNYSNLIPGKDSWVFRTSNDFRKDWAINPATMNYLKSMQDAFRAQNAELIIVIPPIRGMVHASQLMPQDSATYGLQDPAAAWKDYEQSLAAMQARGINVVGVNRAEATEDFFYKRNHHWTASGARLTAQKVAQAARKLPVYSKIPRIEYVTTAKGPMTLKSPFDKAFTTICNSTVPPDTAQIYETTPKAAAVDGGALFDENQGAQVILLGTSNSIADSSQANFEGFLKEYIGADVMNKAHVGGGIDNSIIAYLNSPHFRNGQPKIIIWEIPGYYDLNNMDDKIFNQVIPAAYGACGTQAAYKTTLPPLKKGGNKILEQSRVGQNPAMTKIAKALPAQGDMYMHLDFPKQMKEKFSVEFDYGAGGIRKQLFDRDDQYSQQDGAFFTQFPASSGHKLNGIKIIVSEKMTGMTPQMELCPLPSTKAKSL